MYPVAPVIGTVSFSFMLISRFSIIQEFAARCTFGFEIVCYLVIQLRFGMSGNRFGSLDANSENWLAIKCARKPEKQPGGV